ncbi:MAG: glutaredoxin family protein [Candidatus Marinimicrobia bacterium]|nr:glutaredoxin family protein [Candidatus Neomarinimicrobiota bacterium]
MCEAAHSIIMQVAETNDFELIILDISQDDDLLMRFGTEIPVVEINGDIAFKYRVNKKKFIRLLKSSALHPFS